jgi:uncharacterized membrane-anchored protein
MAAISGADPASSSFADRSHLVALRRSVAVAAAGVAVWIAVIGSSSSLPSHEKQSTDIGAPSWTYRGASALGVRPSTSPQPKSSCYIF